MQHDDEIIDFIPDEDNIIDFKPDENDKIENDYHPAVRHAGRIGRMAATSVSSMADIPNLAAMGLHAAGLKKDPLFYESVGARVQKKIDDLTQGKLKPRSKAEEWQDVIGEAVLGGGIPGVGRKVVGKVLAKEIAKKTARQRITDAASSAASAAAMKTYVDDAEEPNALGALAASYLGGVGARSAINLRRNIHKGVGKATGFDPERYKLQKEIEMPVSLGSVSRHDWPLEAEMIMSRLPGSSKPLRKLAINQEKALAQNMTINDLEADVASIPKYLAKKGAEGRHKRISNIYGKHKEKFLPKEEQAIKNKELLDVNDLIHDLEAQRDRRIATKDLWSKSPEGKLLSQLKKNNPELQAIKHLEKQGYAPDVIKQIMKQDKTPASGLGLEDINDLRKIAKDEYDAAKRTHGIKSEVAKDAYKRYKDLAQKRHSYITEHGTPEEIHYATRGRKLWANYKNEEKGLGPIVESILGQPDDAKAFAKLMSTDPRYIKTVSQGLPKSEKLKLFQSLMAEMGDTGNNRFGVNQAQRKFSNLETPVKDNIINLLPNETAKEKFTKSLKYISNNKDRVQKLANTSGTAHTAENISQGKKWLNAAGALAGIGVSYVTPVPAIAAATGYGTLKGIGKATTNQKFISNINEAMKNPTNLKKEVLRNLTRSTIQTGRSSDALNKKKKLHITIHPDVAYSNQ